jgi:hypothetical protein
MSVLAIVETIAATLVALWISSRVEGMFFLSFSVCVAPFLLLRTEESTILGLKYLSTIYHPVFRAHLLLLGFLNKAYKISRGDRFLTKQFSILSLLAYITVIAIVFIIASLTIVGLGIMGIAAALLAKVAATVRVFAANPIKSLTAIPSNWYRYALCTDAFALPEIIPGIEKAESVLGVELAGRLGGLKMRDILKSVKNIFRYIEFDSNNQDKSTIHKIARIIVAMWIYPLVFLFSSALAGTKIILYIIAMIYRYSLKSTSLAYYALVWAVRSKLMNDLPARVLVKDVLVAPLERLSRWYSWFVVIFLTLLPVIVFCAMYTKWMELRLWAQEHVGPHFNIRVITELNQLFIPINNSQIVINTWHITQFLTAAITIGLFFYAERVSRRLDEGLYAEDAAKTTIGVAALLRSVFGLWTTLCSAIIVARSVRWSDIPPFVIRFLP